MWWSVIHHVSCCINIVNSCTTILYNCTICTILYCCYSSGRHFRNETNTIDCVSCHWLSLLLCYIGVRSQLKQKNIDNISKAEEQAAQQNYDVSIYLLIFSFWEVTVGDGGVGGTDCPDRVVSRWIFRASAFFIFLCTIKSRVLRKVSFGWIKTY